MKLNLGSAEHLLVRLTLVVVLAIGLAKLIYLEFKSFLNILGS
jgi:hypothetical protein